MVSLEQLRKVSYLDVDSLHGRVVNLMPLWDGSAWHMWVPMGDQVTSLQMGQPVLAEYIAREAASPSDVLIPFVDLMWQYASWNETHHLISSIIHDFHNLATSIEKTSLFFSSQEIIGTSASYYMKTEVEYIFMLSRSVFDLLQELFRYCWSDKVRLNDPSAEARRKANKLPETFSKMVLVDKQRLRTVDEIIEKFALPEPISIAYAQSAAFFSRLRDERDAIVHSGRDYGALFVTEKGFAVHRNLPGLNWFNWKDEHLYDNNLASLLPILAEVVIGTINTCSNLMMAFSRSVLMLPPIAPGYQVFTRGPHNNALLWAKYVYEGGSPWWSERPTDLLCHV